MAIYYLMYGIHVPSEDPFHLSSDAMGQFMQDSPGSVKIRIPSNSAALRADQVEPRA